METVKGTVTLKQVSQTLMLGTDSRGQSIAIGYDRTQEPHKMGIKPSDLLLLAAASCSTYDVISILEKQREPLLDLEVTCTGEQITEAPYNFVSVHLHYIVDGDVDPDKLGRAIQLSEEKYCSVLSTLKPAAKISSDFEIRK
jgi:putative redox protein